MKTFSLEPKSVAKTAGLVVLLLVMVLLPRQAFGQSYCNNPTPGCPDGNCTEPGPDDPSPGDPTCGPPPDAPPDTPDCELGQCPKCPPGGGGGGGNDCSRSPCYVRTGSYSRSEVDLRVKTAAGWSIPWGRSYESTRLVDGPLGLGWKTTLTSRLFYAVYFYAAPSTYSREARIILPNGARLRFIDTGNGTFSPPAGRHDVLVRNGDGSFDLTVQTSGWRYHYTPTGAISSMTDRYGNAITFSNDASGKLQQVADASGSGRWINVYWGASGRISSVQDNAGRTIQYGYGGQGNLISVTDPLNYTTTYGTVAGKFVPLLAGITDNWGRVITAITYDRSDRVHSYTDRGETYTYTYAYQGNANNTAKTDSSGNVWVYPVASGTGLVSSNVPPSGSGVGTAQTSYYADGSVQQRTDEVGVKTYYTYDAAGHVLSVTKDYQGPTAIRFDYAYDPAFPDKVTSITPKDPSTGNVNYDWQGWQYVYWQAGDPAPGALRYGKRVKNDGTTETLATYSYDSHGRPSQQLSAGGGVTDYAYDATTGNLLTVTAPANNDGGTRPVTTYGNYDGVGRPQTVTDPLSHATTYTYDSLGRVLTVTLPPPSSGSGLNFTTTYSYDNFDPGTGLTFMNITDPNSKLTKPGYDQFGRLVRSIDANNKVTAYGYTTNLLTSITDANNNVTSYGYDVLKRLTKTTFPDTLYETYTYWGDGLLKSKTDRKSQTINYAYDNQKRLHTKTYPDTSTITYSYTGQKLTQVVDTSVSPTETHTFFYDTSYRLGSNTQATRGTLSYTYTAEDQPLMMAITNGPSSAYTYYLDRSLDTLTWSPVAQPFKYTYRLNGQYSVLTFPNGQTRTYSYDNQGRLLQLANALGSTNLATYAYGYDVDNSTGLSTMLGQRTSLTANVPTQGFTNALTKYYYDPLYPLTKAAYPSASPFNSEIDSWSYDAIGNRLTNTVNGLQATYTYLKNGSNPLNGQRLSNDGTNAYTWDNNGSNLTRNGTPGNFTFGYSYDNRPSSISGAATATYTYDYQGRRTNKTVGSTTTTYLYDGLNLVTETTGGNTVNYAFGPAIDEPLATYQNGTLGYMSPDALGSVAIVSSATGTVQNSYVFDAWGTTRASSATLTDSFGYTGREFGEAGFLFYRARFLQAGVGRFTQEDPIIGPSGISDFLRAMPLPLRRTGSQQRSYPPKVVPEVRFTSGPSDYAYVRSRPFFFRDPLGLLIDDWPMRPDPPCPQPKPCEPWSDCYMQCWNVFTSPNQPWQTVGGIITGIPPIGAGAWGAYGGSVALFCSSWCAVTGGCSAAAPGSAGFP